MAHFDPDAKQRLAQATEHLVVAERELQGSLEALPSALRAEKQMIGNALRLALDKLSAAKGELETLLQG